MIPKTIHYCWFGGHPLPEDAVKCIDSWKRYCPDYEIVRWDESNFDVGCCAYTKEAYEEKKWAFVSDYARFRILCDHGGLYFDTDVELIRPMDDICERGSFMGREDNVLADVAPGLGLGMPAGHGLLRELLDRYHALHFRNPDGSLNQTTVVKYTTDILRERGLREENAIQTVDGITIYPKEYFCPKDYRTGEMIITENTHSIHHYTATWLSGYAKREAAIRHRLRRFTGVKIAAAAGRIYSLPYRVMEKYRKLGLKGTILFAWSKRKR